jgi:hypothetical protein
MLTTLLGAILGLLKKLQYNYGTDMERYILQRNPQTAADVEKLTFEYNSNQNRRFL